MFGTNSARKCKCKLEILAHGKLSPTWHGTLLKHGSLYIAVALSSKKDNAETKTR